MTGSDIHADGRLEAPGGLGSYLVDRRRRSGLGPSAEETARRPFRRKAPPGLRSAEVAVRAGIDPGYYAKLEQGRATSPSPEVLDALARALELNDAEWQHLFDLARRGRATWHPARPTGLPAGARALLDDLRSAPAYVIDPAYDLLGWNSGMCAVFGDPAGLPPACRNVVWMMFAIPAMQDAIEDWAGHAQRLIAQFRLDWGHDRHTDPRFERLRVELAEVSDRFRTWWPRQEVQGRQDLTKRVLPPGSDTWISFIQTTWAHSTSPGVRFVAYAPDGPENLAAAQALIGAYRAQGG
jgi:transcriptional regulator with XRE-family HTH domain